MNEGAITLSAEAIILYCNRRFAEMLGRSAESLMGRTICDVVVPTDRDECTRMLELAKTVPTEGEIMLERADGTSIPVHLTLSPLPLEGAAVVCGVVTDLTEHKHNVELRVAQAALHESEARYRQADKHKDEFLAILAHELRNPLAPATNALHILQLKAPPIPELQWAREVIATQIQRMTRLIDDLMDVSRITSNKLTLRIERVELARVIEEALTTSRPFIDESQHKFSLVLPKEPGAAQRRPRSYGTGPVQPAYQRRQVYQPRWYHLAAGGAPGRRGSDQDQRLRNRHSPGVAAQDL
jgi:PAS domain S-box-containing protein